MIKLSVFDLDGTLADTIDDIKNGLNGMLSEYGFPTVTREQALAAINNGATELVRRCLPEKHRTNESFVLQAKKTYEKYYSACYNQLTCEYSGCTNALRSLVNQGVHLAVLSNKQDEFVKKIVDKLFPGIPFACVMGQTDRFPTKPNPTAILHIIRSLGVTPCQVALVGDSNIDMLTAQNAGVIPIGVAWGYRPREFLYEHGARIVLSKPNEITDIITIFK